MTNNFRMSYFMPPIAPIRNEQGQTVTPATLTPFCEVSVEQVYQMITCNENLKALTEQVRPKSEHAPSLVKPTRRQSSSPTTL